MKLERITIMKTISREMRLAYFTACSVNYLKKAVAMSLSLLDYEPNAHVYIVLVDSKREIVIDESKVKILWAEDLDWPNYKKNAFKYNVIELNTAIKPHVTLRLFEKYDRVIYLDPDICVYSKLTPIHEELNTYSVLLTPHALTSYKGKMRPNDQDFLKFGVYNLGFFAVKNDDNSKAMLKWWDEKCHESCYYEPQIGLGVDQKWMNLAPVLFQGLKVMIDPGLNVAFWNLHEREISNKDGVWYVNNSSLIRFIHYSSFDESDEKSVGVKQTRYDSGERVDFINVSHVYRNYLLKAEEIVKSESDKYGYNCFANGERISPALRRFYAVSQSDKVNLVVDPFDDKSIVYKYAKKNNLLCGKGGGGDVKIFKDKKEYLIQQKIIAGAFGLMLRFLGSDKYFYLLRYLSEYSSIFNQVELIKRFDKKI